MTETTKTELDWPGYHEVTFGVIPGNRWYRIYKRIGHTTYVATVRTRDGYMHRCGFATQKDGETWAKTRMNDTMQSSDAESL